MKLLLLRLCIITLCVFTHSAFAQKTIFFTDTEQEYKKGLELFDKKLYNAALECFQTYIENEQSKNSLNRIDAEFFSAACALELFHKDGEWRFRKFIKEHPGSNRIKWAYFYLGKSNFRKKKYDEVIRWLEQVEVYDLNREDLAELYFKRGYAYFETGNYSKAKPDLYEIKDIDNKYADPANYYYSHIAYQEKNYETAAYGFRRLLRNKTFGSIVPYYISQIYFLQAKFDSVIQLAPSLLNDTLKVIKRGEICKIIGESYYRKKKYEEAIPYLKEYGSASQEDNYTLGYAHYRTGKLQEAINYFSNAVTGNDSLAQNAWYHLADCQLKTGEKSKSRNSFFLAHKSGSDESIKEDALYSFAKLSYELSLSPFNDAINAFNLYISKYPNSTRKDEAYRYLINVFTYTKNYREAMKAIEKINNPDLSLRTVYQRMAWNLGINFFNMDQNDSARYYFNIAKSNGIDARISAQTVFWEGEINYREKKYTNAIEQFKLFQNNAVSAALPEFETANYNLGYCYYTMKDYEKAKSYFDLYLKKQNDESKMADAAARLADCWFIKNDFANAAENYEHAIQIGKTDVEYCLYQKAICSGRQKHYQEKIADLKSLLEKYPSSGISKSAYLEIAESYVRDNQYDNAIVWYNSYLNKFPEGGMENSIKAQIAVLFNNMNDKEKALNYFLEILKKDPKSQEAQLTAIPGIKSILLSQSKMEEWEKIAEQFGIAVNKDEMEDAYYNKAREVYTVKQNCDLSITECDNYLLKFPEGPHVQEINYWLGECAFAKNDFDKALPCYLYLLKQKPNSLTENAIAKAAFIHNKKEQFNEALPLYEELIKITTDPQLIYNSKVNAMRCAWTSKNFEHAIKNASLVISDAKAKSEQIWEARRIRSQGNYQIGNLNEALEDYKLIAKHAESEQGAEALFYISSIYLKQGNYKDVEKTTDKLMSYKYASKYWMTKGLLVMSDAYVEQKNYSDAEALLHTIIDSQNDQVLIKEAQIKLDEISKIQNSKLQKNEQGEQPEIEFKNNDTQHLFEKEQNNGN